MRTIKNMGIVAAILALAGCMHDKRAAQQQPAPYTPVATAPSETAPAPAGSEAAVSNEPSTQGAEAEAQQAIKSAKEEIATEGDTAQARAATQEAVQKACDTQSPQLKAEADQLCQTQAEMKDSIVLTNFDFDKATLKDEMKKELEPKVGELKDSGKTVKIEGHADRIGPSEYNEKLSLRRAEATRDFLLKEGVPQDRIQVTGVGESDPAIEDASAAERAENRRVVVTLAGQ